MRRFKIVSGHMRISIVQNVVIGYDAVIAIDKHGNESKPFVIKDE